MSDCLKNVKVGDVLAVWYGGWHRQAPARCTVAKVGKLHVTDSTGVKWRFNGRRTGRDWSGQSAEPWGKEADDAVREQAATNAARKLADLLTKAANRDTKACIKHHAAIKALLDALGAAEVTP